MKKTENQYKYYINLSKYEAILLNKVRENVIFSTEIIRRKTGWKSSRIKNILTSLKNKSIIVAIKKNSYVIKIKIPENIFNISNHLVSPSYISFWTAFSYYGSTEQQINSIQLVSTVQYKNINVSSFNVETTTFSPDLFFGYKKIDNFVIAEKEKLILDSLYKLEKLGSLDELKKCINNIWEEINQNKLFKYLKKINNKSLFARLGYLLENLNLNNKFENEFLKNLPLSFIKLNTQKQNKRIYIKKWKVMAND